MYELFMLVWAVSPVIGIMMLVAIVALPVLKAIYIVIKCADALVQFIKSVRDFLKPNQNEKDGEGPGQDQNRR